MPKRPLFPKVCIAMGFSDVASLLRCARDEVAAGEDFLEFRLDFLSEPGRGVEAIRSFVKENPGCSILATCRRHQNHGRFNGSIEEQVRILEAATEAGSRGVDIEIESAESAPSQIEPLRAKVSLIISYHNFTGTPALEPVLRRMMRFRADAYKLVTLARKPSDNHRLLSLARSHGRAPLILLAMGEVGFPTRVLSPACGGLYSYAAPRSAGGTASGQVSARLMRQCYRVDRLSKSVRIYGVIADPVRHSISPAVHNRAFHSRRIDAVYLPLLVAPSHLKDFFTLAEKLPLAGFSVTIPHKHKILRYLDGIDPLARRIGAVNTVWRKAGKWRGANTDVDGVLLPLKKKMNLSRSSVLVVGTGGAARGAAFSLADAGSRVSIVGRNPDRARALAKVCGAEWVSRDHLAVSHFDALVHATPLGMYPHVDDCFFPDNIPAEVVFDMVYNPMETVLLRHARDQGKTVMPGIQMFLEQAARQFEIWTGETAPRPVMEKAALEALTPSAGDL